MNSCKIIKGRDDVSVGYVHGAKLNANQALRTYNMCIDGKINLILYFQARLKLDIRISYFIVEGKVTYDMSGI